MVDGAADEEAALVDSADRIRAVVRGQGY